MNDVMQIVDDNYKYIYDVSSRYEDYKNQTPLMAPCLRLMGIQKIFESLDVQNDDIHYTGCLGSNQGYVQILVAMKNV